MECLNPFYEKTHSHKRRKISQSVSLKLMSAGISSTNDVDSVDLKTHKSLLLYKIATEKCHFLECDECPTKDFLMNKIRDFFEKNIIDTISYRCWILTDRPDMMNIEESTDSFCEKYVDSLNYLIRHDYIAKCQFSYIDTKKKNLAIGEVLAEMDFSENFSHFSQNQIQSNSIKNKTNFYFLSQHKN